MQLLQDYTHQGSPVGSGRVELPVIPYKSIPQNRRGHFPHSLAFGKSSGSHDRPMAIHLSRQTGRRAFCSSVSLSIMVLPFGEMAYSPTACVMGIMTGVPPALCPFGIPHRTLLRLVRASRLSYTPILI